jgi:hypothetical protein
MGQTRNAYEVLAEEPNGNSMGVLEIFRRKRRDNTK